MRTAALKNQRMTAEFRSNLKLLEKAASDSRNQKVWPGQFIRAREEARQYLAENLLIYPPTFEKVGLNADMSFVEKKQELGLASDFEPSEEEQEFIDHLASGARKNIRSKWIWRIGQEAKYMAREGWFGFFITLTVDPKRCPDSMAMWKEGREFNKYLRRLAKVASKACGQPRAIHEGQSVRDYVRHCGVIEHGSSRHHHHLHMALWMRDIPDAWKVCPNRHIRNPKYRTVDWCKPLSTYWPWSLPGLGRALYFRHHGDSWSKHRFCVPVDRKTRRPKPVRGPTVAGQYVAKYMDREDKAWTHRVKASRGIGLSLLHEKLLEMHIRPLEALTWRPTKYSMSVLATTIHSVPAELLRSLAKTELFVRRWVSKKLDYQTLLQPPLDSFQLMLKSVQNGARPSRMCSGQLYEWVSDHLPVPEGYCEKRLVRAWKKIGLDFPPDKDVPVTALGGCPR